VHDTGFNVLCKEDELMRDVKISIQHNSLRAALPNVYPIKKQSKNGCLIQAAIFWHTNFQLLLTHF
jgi:hypothetical protein